MIAVTLTLTPTGRTRTTGWARVGGVTLIGEGRPSLAARGGPLGVHGDFLDTHGRRRRDTGVAGVMIVMGRSRAGRVPRRTLAKPAEPAENGVHGLLHGPPVAFKMIVGTAEHGSVVYGCNMRGISVDGDGNGWFRRPWTRTPREAVENSCKSAWYFVRTTRVEGK